MTKKGFTLLELLIVIGILAILATAAVLVLNPAELLRQARDSTRVSDLASLTTALGLYLTTANPIDLDAGGARCKNDTGIFSYFSHVAAATTSIGITGTPLVNSAVRAVDGTGWMPVNFTLAAGGSPISNLPIDPTNTATFAYSYGCDANASTLELNANLESTKFTSGSDNKEINTADGGDLDTIYEVGTEPGLDL